MVIMQGCKLNLGRSSSSLEEVTCLLFEPLSHSLALIHSDSSILLFPCLSSPFSPPPPPSPSPPPLLPQTLIPPFSTSSSFLRLHSNSTSPHRVVFLVAGPHDGGSRVLLRFWILDQNSQLFVKPLLKFNQSDLIPFEGGGAVLVSLSHGFSVKLYGSVNVFALHSISAHKIWIFAAKVIDDGGDNDCVTIKLIKCAVIDCSVPICSITISPGYLLLGENNGVRVLPLRPLVKGGARKHGRRRMENNHIAKTTTLGDSVDTTPSNGKIERKTGSVKLRTVNLKHASSVDGTFFVAFKCPGVQYQKYMSVLLLSLKAISIHALSHMKFIVLDSVGDLHLLSLYSIGSEIAGQMRRLSHTVKVQMLAILPDVSARTRTIWVSDGLYSVHSMSVSEVELSVNEISNSENEEEPMKISAMQTIFVSEKVQDLIPLSANAILVLGQGNIFAYAIS